MGLGALADGVEPFGVPAGCAYTEGIELYELWPFVAAGELSFADGVEEVDELLDVLVVVAGEAALCCCVEV